MIVLKAFTYSLSLSSSVEGKVQQFLVAGGWAAYPS